MMFSNLSDIVRGFFALLALLLCLINIANAVLSLRRKKYIFSLFAVLLFAPLYFMWQVIFDFSLIVKNGGVTNVTQVLCDIAWYWWFVTILVLTGLTVLLLVFNIKYERAFITPSSIKVFLDQVPCGVCVYKDNGRVLFTNICMNDLCVNITGTPLLNGNNFKDAIEDGIMTVQGKMWRFAFKDIVLGNENLHEMVASDITTEYAKTQALTKDKVELDRINKELKEYTLSIDDTVRHQEILQAKVNIHDEMNRLMLSTMAAESDDVQALDNILSLWGQNALLLCMEANEISEKGVKGRIEELAGALKMTLTIQEGLPEVLPKEQRSLFYAAAQEAITNAVKHAGAKEMVINYVNTDDGICCDFVNNGTIPESEVVFTGGLKNLDRMASKIGVKVEVNVDTNFKLTLLFPKK